MTTLNLQVAASADDAYENDNGTGFSSGASAAIAIYQSTTATVRYNSGARFTNVTIPAGSTIDSSTVELFPYSSANDDLSCDIYGNDVDDAANFSTEADVTSRVTTTASVSWVALSAGSGVWEVSPEIKTIIQEIVDRGGWASGNDIVILFKGKNASPDYFFVARSYDTASANAPKLNITYTAPSSFVPRLSLLGVG